MLNFIKFMILFQVEEKQSQEQEELTSEQYNLGNLQNNDDLNYQNLLK